MKIKKQRKIISRYLNGTATTEEVKWVDQWYKAFEGGPVPTLNLPDRAINKFAYLKYAAAIIMVGFISLKVFNWYNGNNETKYITISTAANRDTTFRLPDSSTVWLNGKSKLSYEPATFNHKNRQVYLSKGEAYFEVKRDTLSPFSVTTSNQISVKVLGTGFNVYSDTLTSKTNVKVSHGLVQVSLGKKKLSLLKKGEALDINTITGKWEKENFDPEYAAAWRSSEHQLENVSFDKLSQLYFSRYKIRLLAGNNTVRNYTYTMSMIKTDTWESTLSIITSIHNNSYRQNGTNITIY